MVAGAVCWSIERNDSSASQRRLPACAARDSSPAMPPVQAAKHQSQPDPGAPLPGIRSAHADVCTAHTDWVSSASLPQTTSIATAMNRRQATPPAVMHARAGCAFAKTRLCEREQKNEVSPSTHQAAGGWLLQTRAQTHHTHAMRHACMRTRTCKSPAGRTLNATRTRRPPVLLYSPRAAAKHAAATPPSAPRQPGRVRPACEHARHVSAVPSHGRHAVAVSPAELCARVQWRRHLLLEPLAVLVLIVHHQALQQRHAQNARATQECVGTD